MTLHYLPAVQLKIDYTLANEMGSKQEGQHGPKYTLSGRWMFWAERHIIVTQNKQHPCEDK